MKSVHVTFEHRYPAYPHQPMLLVEGWPSQDLVHMHLACKSIRLNKDLSDFLKAKQAKPLICTEHKTVIIMAKMHNKLFCCSSYIHRTILFYKLTHLLS